MSTRSGVVIGIVKDIDDPIGEGRVRVQFPWLSEEELSGWAPIARPMAGANRGLYVMPELEDEALVAFELDDENHPYVLGFLHNGVDLPPYDDIDAGVRRLRTVSGHVLEFDDRAGQERVTLQSQGGHRLEIDDQAGTLDLTTAGGQTVQLQDTPARATVATAGGSTVAVDDVPSTVELRTAGGVSIRVSDAGGITVSAPAGALAISCLNASVTATSGCTVSAPVTTIAGAAVSVNSAITTFSGAVQCSALITGSVVSASYSPGAGNLL